MSSLAPNRHGDALLTRRCPRCGAAFTTQYAGGRPPVVCSACRPAHQAALAARRTRRYRQRQAERAEYAAYSWGQQAAYQAGRLLAQHPTAVDVLVAQVSPEVADLVIDELLRRRAATQQRPDATAERKEG